MEKFRVLLLLLPVLLMSNQCEKDDDDSDTYTCSYSVTQTLDTTSNVTNNFTDNNVSKLAVLTSATCPGLTAGNTNNSTVDSVTRAGNTLTVTETIDGDTETTTTQIDGTNIVSQTATLELNGCQITATISGRLNTTDNDVILIGDARFSGDTCKDLTFSTLGAESEFHKAVTPLMNYFR